MKLKTVIITSTIIALITTTVLGLLLVGSIGMTSFSSSSLAVQDEFYAIGTSSAGYRTGTDVAQTSGNQRPSGPESDTVEQVTQIDYNAMFFNDYGTHVFVPASKDPLSTFALDVDTASYTIAKNYLVNGNLPPTDAIRPEEFINYFDYEYQDTEQMSIIADGMVSPFEQEITYLRIGIKAPDPVEKSRKVLTLVIDTSGSMQQGNRLELLKGSLNFLLDELDADDEVALITYESRAQLHHSHTFEKESIRNTISSLQPGGSTNAQAGLTLGYQEAQKRFDEDAVNRVILLSDGVANVGNTEPGSLLSQLKTYKDQGIELTTIGVGLGNYNDVLLEQLADNADGNYVYINDMVEGRRAFTLALESTLETIARDAKIQVQFNPESVNQYRLIGYENREIADKDFRNNDVDAGEIGVGHEVTALYELKLSGQQDLGSVTLRYKDPKNDRYVEVVEPIRRYSVSRAENASSSIKLAVAVARFAQILKLSQPPPSIDMVQKLLSDVDSNDEIIVDLKQQVSFTKRFIDQRRGE